MTIYPRATRHGARLDWVKFDFDLARDGSVDPTDKALYAALASFVDSDSRESPETVEVDLNGIPLNVPTRKRLAACIGRSLDTVDRSTARLEARGLLRVHRQQDPDNPKLNLPSEYELLDHEIWDQRAAERAAAREARRQGGSRIGAATPGGTHAATPGRMGAAVKDEREVEEEKKREKTSDVRRTGTSGSRGSGSSGSAASGKTKPDPLTREQRRHVDAFFQALPQKMSGLVPNRVPRNLSIAVLDALAGGQPQERTAQQLIEYRLLPKWNKHYASRDAAGPIEKPVGVLIAMLRRDRECGDARCDERTNVDTGQACRSCAMRAVDKRADRAAETPPERPQGPRPEPAKPVRREALPQPAYVPQQATITPGLPKDIVAQAREGARAGRGLHRASRMP
ncbi:hypothetical protein [Streptomyces caniscabiei]|uniref:hypothetical protein n=1 Tax=Streptomyces caniscabiei TaxID=2746961 RepID=UPI0029B1F494|nr:hypothetical protein [Streptomyces caniscabiei]MDX2986526.1 hypothetical protein [Streptomyces caniscabiei]